MRPYLLLLLFSFPVFLSAQDLYFPPVLGNEWETVELSEIDWCEDKLDELFDQLEDGGTKAFIVLKDGKIVIEKYFGDFEQDDTHAWNSAGKTMTTFLVGMAQEEGFLKLEDKTSDYLGTNWTTLSPEKEDLITIRHQLTMTTGLDDSEPFCTDSICLKYLADAGTRWSYHNGPYTLLSEVLESATGKTPNSYFASKLPLQTGIGGLFVNIGYNKIFFSKPRNMARFGLLVLNKGKWENTTILGDQNYLNQMVTRSQNLNNGYGYLWWLNDTDDFKLPGSQITFPGNPTPNAPREMYSAIGKNGQFLDIVPSENLVVIRMGDAPDNDFVPLRFHDEMWGILSEVICTSTSAKNIGSNNDFSVFPNPFSDEINLEKTVESARIFNSIGQTVFEQKNTNQLPVYFLPKGIYFLKLKTNDGQVLKTKILKK